MCIDDSQYKTPLWYTHAYTLSKFKSSCPPWQRIPTQLYILHTHIHTYIHTHTDTWWDQITVEERCMWFTREEGVRGYRLAFKSFANGQCARSTAAAVPLVASHTCHLHRRNLYGYSTSTNSKIKNNYIIHIILYIIVI